MLLRAIDMKTCSKCKQVKSREYFGTHKSNKDGLQYQCKICRIATCASTYKKISVEQKEVRNKTAKAWRDANKDRVKKYAIEYVKNNRDKLNALQKKREAEKLLRVPKWLNKEQLFEIEQFYVMAKELEQVFPWKQHVDHIVPLQGKTVSGLHVPWNLQILSVQANIQKGNKHNG